VFDVFRIEELTACLIGFLVKNGIHT
jgi:hypothetical protein